MISVNLPFLDIDADVKLDEKGLSVSVKKFDINNFSIDKVFKHFDKKYAGTKDKLNNKDTSTKYKKNNIQNNDEYVINIQ